MARPFLKAAFILAVISLMLVFLVPGYMLLEFFLPTGRGGDRLMPGVVVICFCLWSANRITSLLFWRMHLSDERWSLLSAAAHADRLESFGQPRELLDMTGPRLRQLRNGSTSAFGRSCCSHLWACSRVIISGVNAFLCHSESAGQTRLRRP